ncbi:MFS transporter [bacterium]|nr:MFS transporter [bacterium]MCI0606078.1 MFS transporter [bacterium]
MVFSVWPLFVTNVLKANMSVLGLIDGVGDAVVSISQAASGYISDRVQKRKIFVWLGYLFGSMARIGYALAPSWQVLIPFRILDRSGKMRGSPRDAIISDVSTDQNRGRNFGFLRAMDNLGATVGTILSILLIQMLAYRSLFALAAIPSTFAVILIVFMTKEQKTERKIYRGVRLSDFGGDLKVFTVSSGLLALASFSYSFLLVYASREGFSTPMVPALYLAFNLVAALVSLPFGRLADRIGRKPVLYLAFVFWGLVNVALIVQGGKTGILLAFVLYGLHKGSLEPVQKAFVAELAPREFVASSLGGYQMVIGLLSLPASLFAGLLWDEVALTAPFYFSLALTALALLVLSFVRERR